ncbi:MAG: ABC transporter permease [Thermomicrobiales bacterium]|nr:ABC transporter permease [Thermomicrobiales bacterium]
MTSAAQNQRPERRRGRVDIGGVLLRLYVILVALFLLSPIFIILLTSFTPTESVEFPPRGFSLMWYGRLVDHLEGNPGTKPGLTPSILMSAQIGLVVAILAVVVGVLVAYALHKYAFPGKEVFRNLFLLPLMFPQLVIGVGLLLVFSEFRWFGYFERLVIGHVILTIPFVILTVGASLEVYEQDLEEAAMGLGANPVQTFFLVTLPLIRQGIIAGAIFAFVTSFTQFTVTFFLYSGSTKPLPMWIYEIVVMSVDPLLAVVSILLIALAIVVVVVLSKLVDVRRLFGGR